MPPPVQHRHCIFTIDENLCHFFSSGPFSPELSLSFSLQCNIPHVFNLKHAKNFTPGYIMALHTFGRDLKWNPHIHYLLSEGGYSDNGFCRHVKHFNYNHLRNAFRTALLNELKDKIGPSFKEVKAKYYSHHQQGFYVHAKPNLCDPKVVAKYIVRYLGRPVIATSRIDQYGGDTVTFHYNQHEDETNVEETLPVMNFIPPDPSHSRKAL